MYKINKNSPLPLYYQLKDLLITMIDQGKLNPGDKIPSERELCKYHQISRMTVHKAVEQLVQEDYLYRQKGKGTFVAEKKQSRVFSPLASFSAEMEAHGYTASSMIKNIQQINPGEVIADKLNLAPADQVYLIERLRLIDKKPLLVEKTFIPIKLCPGLEERMLVEQSLYRLLKEEYYYKLLRAEAWVEPILLPAEIAEMLEVNGGTMGLLFYQLTFLKEGEPIEYTQAFYRSEDYKFKFNFNFQQG